MRNFVLMFALLLCTAAQAADLAGHWILTITRFGTPDIRRWNIDSKDGGWSGKVFGATLAGTGTGNSVGWKCSYEEDKTTKPCGTWKGTAAAGHMAGTGTFFDEDMTWTAEREVPRSAIAAQHEFTPVHFYRQFNGNTEPVMHLNPGDTVHTKAVDAGGVDETGKHRSLGGNPLTGPFYIEGALPGDTLAVKLNRVRLNRDSAGIFNNMVVAGALEPYYAKDLKEVKDFDSSWKLDREAGFASLAKPTDRLKSFKIPLQPMLGCIGVAPPNRQVFQSGNLGRYGGNMDYNQVREGVTVYLPVFQQGALLFMGDGHAAQGAGELTGNALETSTDITFTVEVIRDKSIGQPRFENEEFVMVSGIAGSLDDALRMATTGISRWLTDEYKLNSAEVAMVLATSMQYDIAEVVDPQVHVVAKVAKRALAQIPQP